MHFIHRVKPHYLGALLVILAPHQGSIILQKRRRNIDENTVVVMQQRQQLLFSFLFLSLHFLRWRPSQSRVRSGQISKIWSQLSSRHLGVCSCSRKVGSPALGPGRSSGQLQLSSLASETCLIFTRRSPKTRRWELMSALLARVLLLPISSNCCRSATF